MATRREAREWAVQLLFQLDLNPPSDFEEAVAGFWTTERGGGTKARAFTERLVRGTFENREAIDKAIRKQAQNWDLARMGTLDRNVLRMAFYELLFCEDIPPAVSINEAVDIAKYYSNDESGRFVNGLLDNFRKSLGRSARD